MKTAEAAVVQLADLAHALSGADVGVEFGRVGAQVADDLVARRIAAAVAANGRPGSSENRAGEKSVRRS